MERGGESNTINILRNKIQAQHSSCVYSFHRNCRYKKSHFIFFDSSHRRAIWHGSVVQLNASDTYEPGKGGWGYSIYPWVGSCGAARHTLTLFKTNIADFPTLFKIEFRFLIPFLRHLSCLRQKLINRYPDYDKK